MPGHASANGYFRRSGSPSPSVDLAFGMDAPTVPNVPAPPTAPLSFTPHRPRWRNYTAFVLSGGGARGALQAGILQALLEYGERPDVVIGTSIGAWNAAWVARNPTLAGIAGLEAAWHTTHPARVLLDIDPSPHTPAQALASMRLLSIARRLTAGYPSLYSDAGMQRFIERYLKTATFEDMAVPLRIIAADITHGTRAVFSSGPVAPAVLASSAIPGVFPPVRIGDTVYVDGGSLDNCSLETALELGARRIFVLDVGYDESSAGAPLWTSDGDLQTARRGLGAPPIAAVLERTVQVMSRYQLARGLERMPRGIEVHVLRPGTGDGGGALEFGRAPQWIERGYQQAREYLHLHLPQATTVVRS
jgi:NTE family protein